MGHELYHAYQIVSGFSANAQKILGRTKAKYLIEVGAYQWNYRMDPTHMHWSNQMGYFLRKYYE